MRLKAADPLVVGAERGKGFGHCWHIHQMPCPAGSAGIGGDSPVVRGMGGSAQGLSVGAERQRGCWSASSCRARVAPGIQSAMDFKGIIYLYVHVYIRCLFVCFPAPVSPDFISTFSFHRFRVGCYTAAAAVAGALNGKWNRK